MVCAAMGMTARTLSMPGLFAGLGQYAQDLISLGLLPCRIGHRQIVGQNTVTCLLPAPSQIRYGAWCVGHRRHQNGQYDQAAAFLYAAKYKDVDRWCYAGADLAQRCTTRRSCLPRWNRSSNHTVCRRQVLATTPCRGAARERCRSESLSIID